MSQNQDNQNENIQNQVDKKPALKNEESGGQKEIIEKIWKLKYNRDNREKQSINFEDVKELFGETLKKQIIQKDGRYNAIFYKNKSNSFFVPPKVIDEVKKT